MPLSRDEQARHRQLANLQRGAGDAGAGVGNQRAVSHGAYAQITRRRLDAKTREIVDALTADAPARNTDGSLPAADGVAIRLLADALCRLDSIGEYLGRRGWEDEHGNPRSVLDTEARLRSQALELLKEFGMTTASRAKLGLDLARTHRTLEDEVADGRGAWDQHETIDGTATNDGEAAS